jgi:DNA polymerase V
VAAGFPSPADDYVEGPLDLNELLIRRPETTFFLRVRGDSMEGAGIHSGDLLVVDWSVEPRCGDVVIAAVSGSLTVKRLAREEGRLVLLPDSPGPGGSGYEPIEVAGSEELVIWGVVQHVIHEVS